MAADKDDMEWLEDSPVLLSNDETGEQREDPGGAGVPVGGEEVS